MSADNFFLVRRAGSRFALTMEWASPDPDADPIAALDHPAPIDDPRVRWFDSMDDALRAATAEYSEYGVSVDVGVDAGHDTRAARYARAARALAERYACGTFADDDAVVLEIGDCEVVVRGPECSRRELAGWIRATLPGELV